VTPARPAPSLVALTVAAALVLSACSGGSDAPSPDAPSSSGSSSSSSATSSASASPSPAVALPAGATLTDPGSKLSYGDPAIVVYQPRRKRISAVRVTVQGVRRGIPADLKGFILDTRYKRRATYFYAQVAVRNVGDGDLGGFPVPLWGVNAANTLLPAVDFTTSFAACPTRRLPRSFPHGAVLRTCLVFLSPRHGTLTGVSFRPNQQFDPIIWTGRITPPGKAKAKTKSKGKPKGKAKPRSARDKKKR
jgi:hypothetical protein